MQRPSRILAAAACLGAPLAQAADFQLTASQPGSQNWNSAVWDEVGTVPIEAVVPTAGNNYFTNSFILRTPTGGSPADFLGDSLTVNGGTFATKVNFNNTAGSATVNAVLNGGQIGAWNGTTGGNVQYLDGGQLDFQAANTFISLNGTDNRRLGWRSTGTFTGAGDITIRSGDSLSDIVYLNGSDGSAHTGDWTLQNTGRLITQGGSNQIGDSSTVTLSGTGTQFEVRDDETIGGFTSDSNSATANTLNIAATATLTVNGDFIVGRTGTGQITNLATSGGGDLSVVGTNFKAGIGNSDQNSTENSATVDLTGLGSFTADVTNFQVGSRNPASLGSGSKIRADLFLTDTANTITADHLGVSDSGTNNASPAVLTLGAGTNVLNVDDIVVGAGKGNGTIEFDDATGSVVVRGSDGVSGADITVGENTSVNTGATILGTIDFSGHSADVIAKTLTIGNRSQPGNGEATGNYRQDMGTLSVGTGTEDFIAGRHTGDVDASTATGTLDLTGATSSVFDVDSFLVGVKGNTLNGKARGLVTLATNSTVTANEIQVGNSGNSGFDGAANQSELHFGAGTANVTTPVLTAGVRKTHGLIDVAAGGTVNLGTAEDRTAITLGWKNASTAASPEGTIDFSAGTSNIFASEIVLARESDGGSSGNPVGNLILGDGSLDVSGSITEGVGTNGQGVSTVTVIGDQTFTVAGAVAPDTFNIGLDGTPGSVTFAGTSAQIGSTANPTDLFVGRRNENTATTFQGTLDLSGLATFTATLDEFGVGTTDGSVGSSQGQPRGVVLLAPNSTIDARLIQIGDSRNVGLGGFNNRVEMGALTTITADEVVVGGDKSVGTIGGELSFAAGAGTLTLSGSSGARASLFVGEQEVGTGGGAGGLLDLTGGIFNATLNEFVIGSKPNGATGTTLGTALIDDGTIDTNTLVLGERTDAGTAGTVTGLLALRDGTITVNSDPLIGDGGAGAALIDGTLVVNGGTNTVIVNNDARGTGALRGEGLITGDLQVNDDGLVEPGTTDDLSATGQSVLGTLSVDGDATFATGSTLELQVTLPTDTVPMASVLTASEIYDAINVTANLNDNPSTSEHDALHVSGDLEFADPAGTINITFASSFAPAMGQWFDLFDFGTLTGLTAADFNGGQQLWSGSSPVGPFSFPNFSASPATTSLRWDTSLFLSDGIIFIVPEPSRGLLLLLGLTLAVLRRRR